MNFTMHSVFLASTAICLSTLASASDSITKPKIRGEMRTLWERNVQASVSPMLEAAGPNILTTPIFTIGATINGYTPPGIFDGMGAYKLNESTVRVLVNHELLHDRGYSYPLNRGAFNMTGARVSFLDIDASTYEVVNAGLAYDKVFDADGLTPTDLGFLQGRNGFGRFCSGRLVNPPELGKPFFESGSGVVDRIYFAPEEDGGNSNSVGGAVWAIDVENMGIWSAVAMGRGAWENVAPVDTGDASTVGIVLTDDTSPFDVDGDGVDEAAPLYLYIGTKTPGSDFGQRNGLVEGDLYVLVLDDGRTRPSQFGRTERSTTGRWVKIDNTKGEPDATPISENPNSGFDAFGFPTQRNLWMEAKAAGSFGFSRPEGKDYPGRLVISKRHLAFLSTDVHESPNDGTTVVVASTGVDTYDVLPSGDGADSFGTLYTIKTDFSDMSLTLTILYDGDKDPARAIRSPDNLFWADGEICITEDRAEVDTLTGEMLFGGNAVNTNEASVVCINEEGTSIDRLAEVDRGVVLDASLGDPTLATDVDAGDTGAWESSGIIEVTNLFSPRTGKVFLVNVQAHGIEDQEMGSRINDADLVEGGQMILLQVMTPDSDSLFNPRGLWGLVAIPILGLAVYLCIKLKPSWAKAKEEEEEVQEEAAPQAQPSPVAQDPPLAQDSTVAQSATKYT